MESSDAPEPEGVTKQKAPGECLSALWLPAKRARWRQVNPNPKEELEAPGLSQGGRHNDRSIKIILTQIFPQSRGFHCGVVKVMVSAVLFDLDGTILNCIEPMSKEFVKIVEKLGLTVTEEIRKKVSDNLGEILIKRASPIAEVLLLWRLGRFIGIPFYKRAIMILVSYSRLKSIANNSPPFGGTSDVLKTLKMRGLKLALVTTRNRRDVASILKKFSLDAIFDAIVTRDDVSSGKPSPEPVFLATKKLNLTPSDVVFVGDMPTDIESGKRAGVKTIGILGGLFDESLLRATPDLLINSILDLPEVLEKFEG